MSITLLGAKDKTIINQIISDMNLSRLMGLNFVNENDKAEGG